jgi:hypothetical protein
VIGLLRAWVEQNLELRIIDAAHSKPMGSSSRADGIHEFIGPLVSHCYAKPQAQIYLPS